MTSIIIALPIGNKMVLNSMSSIFLPFCHGRTIIFRRHFGPKHHKYKTGRMKRNQVFVKYYVALVWGYYGNFLNNTLFKWHLGMFIVGSMVDSFLFDV